MKDKVEIQKGDKIILECNVNEVYPTGLLRISSSLFGVFTSGSDRSSIKDVIKRSVMVGDTVFYDGCSYDGVTLLAIHGDGMKIGDFTRLWGVVAFEGDIPRVIDFSKLRTFR